MPEEEVSYYELALTSKQVLVTFIVALASVALAFFAGVWVGQQGTDQPMQQRRQVAAHRFDLRRAEGERIGGLAAGDEIDTVRHPAQLQQWIAAADTAWHMRHADMFGVSAADIQVDGHKVMQRVRRMRVWIGTTLAHR